MKLKDSQKGISLYLAIVILVVILAIAMGLSTILVSQFKIIAGMGNSVKALYAADTGIEQALVDVVAWEDSGGASVPPSSYSGNLDNASYEVEIVCCQGGSCQLGLGEFNCPSGFSIDPDNCEATYLCVRSRGTYKDTQRAIEVRWRATD